MGDAEEGGVQDSGGHPVPSSAEEAESGGGGAQKKAGAADERLLSAAGSRGSVRRGAEKRGLCLRSLGEEKMYVEIVCYLFGCLFILEVWIFDFISLRCLYLLFVYS